MEYILEGLIAFLLFFLYDLNSVLWKNRILHKLFLAGCFILVVATISMIQKTALIQRPDVVSVIFLILTIASFLLFIYTLFFALPFDKTYKEVSGPADVYTGGVYSLCRHPGVLWMFFFYLFLGLLLKSRMIVIASAVYTIYNIAYVLLQDFWTFPKTLSGYGEYRERTPFLIPTPKSIRKVWEEIQKSREGKRNEI